MNYNIHDKLRQIEKYLENSEDLLIAAFGYPEINLSENSVGIFGNVATLNQVLQDKDRVEIYRSLQMNPIEARRLRAEHDGT